jgi:predicted nuclease of predicted toxin-antitoxin system
VNLLVEVNLGPIWPDRLRAAGHDALHWSEVGDVRAPDREILRYARMQQSVVITRDLDLGDILAATGADGPSVVLSRGGSSISKKWMERVLEVLDGFQTPLSEGALLSVDESRARVRILPLRAG